MACGCSTGARLGLALALATTACRKSESDVDLPPRLDGAVMPSGMGEDASAPLDTAPDAATVAADSAAVTKDAGALIGKFKPPSGDFGAVAVGQASAPQTFTFTNDGEQATGTLATRLGGPNATSFLLDEDRCNAVTLAPTESCAVTLRFKPAETGELAASLILTATGDGTATLVMGGTGL